MMNQPQDLRANRKDKLFGTLKYLSYLVTEPLNYLMQYPSFDCPVYDLSRDYFVNDAVEKRLKKAGKKVRDKIEALEQEIYTCPYCENAAVMSRSKREEIGVLELVAEHD